MDGNGQPSNGFRGQGQCADVAASAGPPGGAGPLRPVLVELTEFEARALRRAAALMMAVADQRFTFASDPPLLTAQEQILRACDRAGVDCEPAVYEIREVL